jgi:hypothetical protein
VDFNTVVADHAADSSLFYRFLNSTELRLRQVAFEAEDDSILRLNQLDVRFRHEPLNCCKRKTCAEQLREKSPTPDHFQILA